MSMIMNASSKSKKVLFSLLFVAIVLGVLSLWGYWTLEPTHHFARTQIPVLAVDGKLQNSTIQTTSTPTNTPTNNTTDTSTNTSAHKAAAAVTLTSFNVLLLGVDSESSTVSHSDVILVAHVIPSLKKVNLISIPRDTRVEIPGVGYSKITHAHYLGESITGGTHGGTEAIIQSISRLLHIEINYYAKTNFAGFRHIVDTIGGVDIDLEKPVKLTWDELTLPAGKQHLNGDMTLKFVRERYSLENGDFDRQKDQALVLKAILKNILQPGTLPKIPQLIQQVRTDFLDTNFKNDDIISLAWLFENIEGSDILYLQLPGRHAYLMDPILKRELYYWLPDEEKIQSLVKSNFFSTLNHLSGNAIE